MAWEARSGWKPSSTRLWSTPPDRLNGLGSPFGMETRKYLPMLYSLLLAKWPGKAVRGGNLVFFSRASQTPLGTTGPQCPPVRKTEFLLPRGHTEQG